MSWPWFCRVPELGIYYSTKGEQADAKRTTNLYEGIPEEEVRRLKRELDVVRQERDL